MPVSRAVASVALAIGPTDGEARAVDASRSPLGLLLIAAMLAGCGGRAVHRPLWASPPAMVITVFDDGFHSGFILPYAGAPYVLDPQLAADSPWSYVEIGFGEKRWIQGLDRSWLHGLRLGLWPADGMLLLVDLAEPTRPDRDEGVPTCYWRVALTELGVAAFFARLDGWIDRSHHYVRPADDPQFFYWASRRYTPFNDCHDFTIDVLQSACFPISAPLIVTAGRFASAMDRGVCRLRAAGIDAIGP